ncbi:PilZ domain-containing protein [Neptuniibacter sp. QD37_11]|uniref:PilZ domain-containing protein n=1 Tax=Neptuniibacter sp. QD37_11 TaxID=3398209 RepID=UPI0039F4B1D5
MSAFENRRFPRFEQNWTALIVVDDKQHTVTLENISREGMTIIGDLQLSVGTEYPLTVFAKDSVMEWPLRCRIAIKHRSGNAPDMTYGCYISTKSSFMSDFWLRYLDRQTELAVFNKYRHSRV